MDREFLILNHISEQDHISQRKLTKVLDVSLGTVNGLIQQMLQKEWITLDLSNPKMIKYHLTPLGHQEKAQKNYEWISQSYQTISKTKVHIRNVIEKQIQQGIDSFFLYGAEDALYKLTKMCLMELKREHNIHFNPLADLDTLKNVECFCVLHWNMDAELMNQVNAVNILNV